MGVRARVHSYLRIESFPAHAQNVSHVIFGLLVYTADQMQEWMKHAPEWAQSYTDRLFGAMVEDHRARSFVLAWATCKVLEPVRLLGAIAITPRLARALGRAPAKGADKDDDDDDGDDDKDDKDGKASRGKESK